MNKREIVVDIVRALLILGFSAYEKRKQKKAAQNEDVTE